ncbi:MAG: AtpZ/AtpI family protein [Fretibacterium sp.]|nr:AtpZ/AtpI family protein [Fretibacterium sp.]
MDSPELNQEQGPAPDSHGDEEKLIKTRDKQKRLLSQVVQVSTVAWTTIANIAVGVFLGHWLDKLLGTQPVFSILLSISGVVASILYIFSFSRKQ